MENKKEELELKKILIEIEEKEIDLKLKNIELEIKREEFSSKKKSRIVINQSILVAVIGGLIGIFGSLLNSRQQRINAEELERQKLNSSLILKCVQIDNKYKSLETLQLLLNLGLVKDKENALKKVVNDTMKFKSIKTPLQALSTIKIIDLKNNPIGKAEIFYNDLFVGSTDISGRLSVGFFKELPTSEIKIKINSKEVREYKTYSIDNKKNVITISVVP